MTRHFKPIVGVSIAGACIAIVVLAMGPLAAQEVVEGARGRGNYVAPVKSTALGPRARANQSPPAGVTVAPDTIVGVVKGPKGPEAGVWVIAETIELPTKLSKVVVTDDQGR